MKPESQQNMGTSCLHCPHANIHSGMGVLVELTMPLFHFNNVKVEGNFVRIEGKLGKYNIHLGSGVIHQEGGAQIAVLPVHSQNRGRLFLPFVDEDPKTAEILTKIIFFAEDDKIKDPSILNQIK